MALDVIPEGTWPVHPDVAQGLVSTIFSFTCHVGHFHHQGMTGGAVSFESWLGLWQSALMLKLCESVKMLIKTKDTHTQEILRDLGALSQKPRPANINKTCSRSPLSLGKLKGF